MESKRVWETTTTPPSRWTFWRLDWTLLIVGLVQTFVVCWRLSAARVPEQSMPGMAMSGMSMPTPGVGTGNQPSPPNSWLSILRDSAVTAPLGIAAIVASALIVAAAVRVAGVAIDSLWVWIGFPVCSALVAAAASVPNGILTSSLFRMDHITAGAPDHLVTALVTLRYAFAIALLYAVCFGVPWRQQRREPDPSDRSTRSPS